MKPYFGPVPGYQVGELEGTADQWQNGFSYSTWQAGGYPGTCWPIYDVTLARVQQKHSFGQTTFQEVAVDQVQRFDLVEPAGFMDELQRFDLWRATGWLDQVERFDLYPLAGDVGQAQGFYLNPFAGELDQVERFDLSRPTGSLDQVQGFASVPTPVIAYVRAATGTSTASATCQANFVFAPVAGNCLIVFIESIVATGSTNLTVGDTQLNTYHLGGTKSVNGLRTLEMWYSTGIATGGGFTVGVSNGATLMVGCTMIVLEFFGIRSSSPVDQYTRNTGTGTSVSAGSITTTASGELLLGVIGGSPFGGATGSAGWTLRADSATGPGTVEVEGFSRGDLSILTAGTYSFSTTLGFSSAWQTILCSFFA